MKMINLRHMTLSDRTIRKILLAVAFLLALSFTSSGAEFQKYTMKHRGLTREYWLYVPDTLSVERPLVIMLHGYGGKAEGYRPEMAEVARKNGFVLCVPQGWKAPKGKPGWNVRYPAQEGMTTDDVDFVCALKKRVVKDWSLDARNCFLCGMSNGGDMCYLTVLQRPEAFAAYGSVAGLTMEWCYREYSMTKAVPFLEVHGTADRTSRWEGDPDNEGGWGEYISVPIAVSNVVNVDKCTHCEDIELPLVRNRVILHRYLGGVPAWKGGPAVEVRLYEVENGKHSWALADFDTCSALWDFFKIYLR